MAREQIDPNLWIDPNADPRVRNPNYGVAPTATASFSANTAASTFDIFVGNQGEGTMHATLTWTPADFTRVFMPPHAHRPAVPFSPGDVITLDSLEIVQLVAERPANAAEADFDVDAFKLHKTAASTGNDYVVIGVGSRT